MKTNCMFRHFVLAAALLGAVASASSMTIGRIRGAVILGQPLNLTVPLTVNPGEDGRAICLAADVFNGDAAVDMNRVSVSMEAADASGNGLARIRSAAIIDEPFVTVNFRAGCSQISSRSFVLLADVITDTVPEPVVMAPAAAAPAPPAAITAPPPTPATAPAAVPRPPTVQAGDPAPKAATTAARSAAVAATRPAATQPKPAAAPRSEARGVVKPAPKKAARATQPKLKLDPVETVEKKTPGLRASTELGGTPAVSQEKSAESAALWRSLNTQPEDAVREAQKVQGLEAEVKALRDLTSKNQALLAEMNARLQNAESERRLGAYFYLVLALLLLTLALIAVLWLRLKRRANASSAWWEDREEVAKADLRLRMVSGAAADRATAAAPNVDLDLGGASVGHAAASVAAATANSLDRTATVKMRTPALGQESAAMGLPSKSAHPEELFDIRQQAEFFVSLGQTDQAIALLSNHIRSNEETGPQAYLDLLRIYHSTGKTTDYESLRSSVARVFNVDIPEFAAFGEETRNLESYSELAANVQAAWGTPKAVKMLEELIYRRPGSKWNQAFGLSAYRELLSLHALAKEVGAMPAAERKLPSGFAGLPTAARADSAVKGASPTATGLDLDLGGLDSPSVGNISAYLEKPVVDLSMEATVPARLEDRPKPVQQAAPQALAPVPEPPGNLLDFDVEQSPPDANKPKT